MAEVQLVPGELLLLYTDGGTEAASDRGEEFGENRLIDLVRAQGHLPASALLRTIVDAVQEFSRNDQRDDVTLVAARCGDFR